MEVLSVAAPQKNEKRSRYESVVQGIRAKHGGLEAMRAKLGFTQKQMSELLLVDPSAWTRWVRDGESAPAHIYQALAWYFETRPVASGSSAQNSATSETTVPPHRIAPEMNVTLETWEREKAALLDQWQESHKKAVGISDGWKLFLLMNSVALIYIILSQFI